MADKTKKPTGLTVNRKNNKLVVEWKIGDADYKDGQELYYVRHYLDHPAGAPSGMLKSYNVKVWADVKNSASKFVYSIKESDYFPNTVKRLLAVDFAVRGNRKKYEKKGKNVNPTWSDYAKKTFDFNPPSKPSVSSSFNASEEITTRFTASAKDTDHAPYTRMVWETILVKNASSTDGSKYKWARGQMGWKTGTSQSLSHTETVTESGIAVTATTSYTRFFRAKSQGMGGESAWAYSYHVYGASAKPSAVSPRVSRLDGNMVLDIRVNTPQSASHPIDNSGIKVQYRAEKPDAGLAMPSGDSWTEAGTRNNTAKKNSDYFHFDLGSVLADDNCLWYRIGSTHDGKTTWSDPYLRYIGYLPNPTITQIVPNFESHSVEFRASNASEIADSYLVGVCKVDGQDETIIASSETGGGDKTFYGTIPSGATADTTAFGVRAVVGTLSGSTVKPYSGKLVMDSRKTVWKDDQGRLPIPPSGVSAAKASVEETAEISWQWSWNDADAVQITWSDNPLAWESNEEPSEYTVTRLNAGHWYISGLESGVRWYFRLRFMKGDGDNAVYSAWSEMVSIDLRSAPNKPTLMLSEYVIPADATTTAYWAYVTTDGTPQRYAEICEAIVEEDSPIEYGETIAQTETAQHIDIDPSALGWADGEEHYLCVKVQSASGITSEGWSDPVQLKIAEKPVAVIAEDSLEQQSIEIHPQTLTGDMVQIENPDGVLEATSVRMDLEPVQAGTPWIDSVVESVPYTSRAMSDVSTRVGSHESLRKIVGGTVCWNQLANPSNEVYTNNGVTFTKENGAVRTSGIATGLAQTTLNWPTFTTNHVYGLWGCPPNGSDNTYFLDTGASLGHDIGTGRIAKYTGETDYKYLRVYAREGTDVNGLVFKPQLIDLTALFANNPAIADYIYSLEQAHAGDGVAFFKALFPEEYYPYNAGTLKSVQTSAHKTYDADGNVIGNYALDNSITLMGIPKLDASNNLYYDGDEYPPSGAVNRRFGIVDLGTLEWVRLNPDTNAERFVTTELPIKIVITSQSVINGNMICAMYEEKPWSTLTRDGQNKFMCLNYSGGAFAIRDTTYTDVTTFKSAMSGKYLVYEKATPTTETASPYTEIQSVESGGTEEFVGAEIPVGHESTYSQVYPISGHDSASVVVAGANIWGGLKMANDIVSAISDTTYADFGSDSDGDYVSLLASWAINRVQLANLKFKENTQYTLILSTKKTTTNLNANIVIAYTDGTSSNINVPAPATEKSRFAVTSIRGRTVEAIKGSYAGGKTYFYYNECGIFEGVHTVDDFEPYEGQTYTTSLGRTVYGGTVDLVSGVLTIDRAMVTFDGTEAWTWEAPYHQAYMSKYDMMRLADYRSSMLCDSLPIMRGGYVTETVIGASGYIQSAQYVGQNWIYIRNHEVNSRAEFLAWISELKPTIVYELATPQTYQLTPQQIALLTGDNNVWSDREMTIRVADAVEQGDVLTRLPLELTVTGAGAGRTVVAIERIEPYDMDRPDETRLRGNEGETVALTSQDGEAPISIGADSRLGYLDDGARYQIVATVKDAYGQASEKVYKPFLVRWEHQAVIPNGTVEIDGLIAKLTPSAPSDVPTGWQMADGDHIDIYRLSADRPVLVYPNAKIGETYVDPYPAIGGGYRFVFITKDGDYICTDEDGNEKAAWTDVESEFEYDRMILDFGGDRAELYYNVDEDDDWGKDFQATKYMSGRIVGDWNAGIEHTGDVNAVVITIIDDEVVSAMRRLAEYEGAVHVRTTSGASYDADVQVRRSRSHSHFGTRYSYSLSITRIDQGDYDGIPLALYESEETE